MSVLHLTDINIVARCLQVHTTNQRGALVLDIASWASTADKYRKRIGRNHPQHGNGSLADACMDLPRSQHPARVSGDYLACLAIVMNTLMKIKIRD